MNFETDTEQMLSFFRGHSEFYPDFDRYLRHQVVERFPPADEDTDDRLRRAHPPKTRPTRPEHEDPMSK